MANILKKAGRLLKKVYNSPVGLGGQIKIAKKGLEAVTGGRSARKEAKAAAGQAEQYANEAEAERVKLATKTKKEKLRAQKLAVKGLRSKRAASYFKPAAGTTGTYGSPTIG